MNRFMRSSAFTLAFSYTAFGLIALVLFAVPLWYAWQVTVQEGRAEVLRTDMQRLSEVFHREGPAGLATFIQTRVGMQIANERLLLLTNDRMQRMAGNLQEWPRGLPLESGTAVRAVAIAGVPTQAMFAHTVLPGGYHLLVGRDQLLFASLTKRFWYGLAAAVAVLLIAGLFGGFLIRRAVLLRVDNIQQTVLAIVQGDWSHRLPTRQSSDELDTLSGTINGMLDQIEQLLHGVRDVSNSIAHDLRTPLAELRSRLEELALTRPAAEETFAEIDAAVVDVDRVIRIFNALLRLAEIDTGMRRSGFVAVNAAELARQAVDFYQPAAELRGITLTYQGSAPASLPGDPVLLAQAIGNLIDNALKYTPAGGRIRVELDTLDDERLHISVIDNGPGIPDEEKPKVRARFYRGDASRGTPGVGLGLSLVDAVARVHGGTLELADSQAGERACGLRAQMIIATNPLRGAALSGERPAGAVSGKEGTAPIPV